MPRVWTYQEDRDYAVSSPKRVPAFAIVAFRHCDDEGRQCRECGRPRGWPHDFRCRWDYGNGSTDEKKRRHDFHQKVAALRERLHGKDNV